jgi:simple sugar transport system ATP-binding protein
VPLLEVRNVSKSFGAIQALTGVSFAIEPGEVIGLMGDNGAGKSTMVKLVAGNFPPSEGEVVVSGEVCHFHKPIEARAKGIEVVYQDLAIADNLTAAQNVFLGREITKGFWPFKVLHKQAMIDRAGELFAELKSETRPRDLVRKMSGGQRQAVAIARAVYWNARLVIMDEPTAALGVPEQRKVHELVRTLKQQNVPVIIISHNMQDIFASADRIIVMRRGHKVGDVLAKDIDGDGLVGLMVGVGEA